MKFSYVIRFFQIFLLLISTICSSQTDSIFGLQAGAGDAVFSSKLLKINIADGRYRVISREALPFSPFPGFEASIDPWNGLYIIPAEMGGVDSLDFLGRVTLVNIDVNTGELFNAFELPDHSIGGEFHCEHQLFYGIKTDAYWEKVELFSTDHLTGKTQIISSEPISIHPGTPQELTPQYPFIDTKNNLFCFFGLDPEQHWTLFSIDILTGKLVGSLAISEPDKIHQIVFNSTNSSFYGMLVNYVPNERFLVKIDPSNLSYETLSKNPSDVWYDLSDAPIISKSNESYLFTGLDSLTMEYSLYSYNLQTGTLTSASVPRFDSLGYIAAWNDCKLNQTTKFEKNNMVKIHPNPNNGQFNIQLNGTGDNANIEIFDVTGKMVFQENNVNDRITVDIQNQPRGMYFVKITIGDEVFNEKIVFQ